MKIAVCVKIADGEINPFDECALEEALRICDAGINLHFRIPDEFSKVFNTFVGEPFKPHFEASALTDVLSSTSISPSLERIDGNLSVFILSIVSSAGSFAHSFPSLVSQFTESEMLFIFITFVIRLKLINVARHGPTWAVSPSIDCLPQNTKSKFLFFIHSDNM